MEKDYYLILRLTPEATADEIRSAYRRRALELHPDLSGFSSDPFLELQEAYAVLSDPCRRAAYDIRAEEIPIKFTRRGKSFSDGAIRKSGAEPLIPRKFSHERENISFSRSSGSYSPSSLFKDFFYRIWGNYYRAAVSEVEQDGNLTIEVTLSPQEAERGGVARILVPAKIQCPNCLGSGFVNRYPCGRCGTRGYVSVQHAVDVSFPAGLREDYTMSLGDLGEVILRFRPAESGW